MMPMGQEKNNHDVTLKDSRLTSCKRPCEQMATAGASAGAMREAARFKTTV